MEDRERCLLNIKEALQAMKAACSALETQIDLFLQLDFPSVEAVPEIKPVEPEPDQPESEAEPMEPEPEPVADSEPVIPEPEPVADSEPIMPEPEPVADSEPVMPEPEPVADSELVMPEPEPVADSEPVIPEPEPAEQEAEPEPDSEPKVASEPTKTAPKAAEESLGERFEQSRPRSLQSTFAATSGINIAVSVFSKRLSLNDRFRFQRELCHGDAGLLQKLLEQLDATDTLDQAMDGLGDFAIDYENPAYDDLLALMEQHFTRH